MAKVDLHVHSKFSSHPSEWFLQRLGAAESYTEPEEIFQILQKNGMDFITITDHNQIGGALVLKKMYPEKVIVGMEATTYFPENGCKVHILIYGLDIEQFRKIQEIRNNIYHLREFLIAENLAHAVAHATYDINKKLTIELLEKLILLFDVFEGINGGRTELNNGSWIDVLENLTPSILETLRQKHAIEPNNENSWNKGMIAGSDDHAGLFLGHTYTIANAETIADFLEAIRLKKTSPYGRHNSFKSLAFIVYKIALDFAKVKSNEFSNDFFSEISNYLYQENHTISLKNKLKLRQINSKSNDMDDYVKLSFHDLITSLQKEKDMPLNERWELAYEKISNIVDSFFKIVLVSFEKNLQQGNLLKIVRSISAALPGVFITFPFFSAHQATTCNIKLLKELTAKYGSKQEKSAEKVLWFSDTLQDLNGVSVTLQRVYEIAKKNKKPITIISANQIMQEDEYYIDLPIIHEFELPYYEHQKIKIPSPLITLDKIDKASPDKIIISTPGPVGFAGMMMAKLFQIKCIGIYHTDFGEQVNAIYQDESLKAMVDSYNLWFYKQMDKIFVPSMNYIDILCEQGIEHSKMQLLPRGVDFDVFSPQIDGRRYIADKHLLDDGYYLLYTGRISKDKNLDIVIDAFLDLADENPELHLLLVGDGPYRNELVQRCKNVKQILFPGRINRSLLPLYYSGSDLFVFPSTTDTFGMSVLEAQACGLPALVSPQGGPKEVIIPDVTGTIMKMDKQFWKQKILYYINQKNTNSEELRKMKENSRSQVMKKYGWEFFFKEILSA
jgi:glycosyltransferase involved in cell wall biosynthesis